MKASGMTGSYCQREAQLEQICSRRGHQNDTWKTLTKCSHRVGIPEMWNSGLDFSAISFYRPWKWEAKGELYLITSGSICLPP